MIREAEAIWTGSLKSGQGRLRLGSGSFEGPYTYASRFEEGKGANPEELLGAAHAGCYSMFLSALLGKAGFEPARIKTRAQVHLGEGPRITRIELETEVEADGLREDAFQDLAAQAKQGCPVSQALAAVEITLRAVLVSHDR